MRSFLTAACLLGLSALVGCADAPDPDAPAVTESALQAPSEYPDAVLVRDTALRDTYVTLATQSEAGLTALSSLTGCTPGMGAVFAAVDTDGIGVVAIVTPVDCGPNAVDSETDEFVADRSDLVIILETATHVVRAAYVDVPVTD